ncbi:MAG: SHOCT domain-containing protein [Acidimicrobiales bacterium]
MTMRRRRTHRRNHCDLLARPPVGGRELEGGVAALIVDPIEQLEELADLRSRGFLTSDEFERQKTRVWYAAE